MRSGSGPDTETEIPFRENFSLFPANTINSLVTRGITTSVFSFVHIDRTLSIKSGDSGKGMLKVLSSRPAPEEFERFASPPVISIFLSVTFLSDFIIPGAPGAPAPVMKTRIGFNFFTSAN